MKRFFSIVLVLFSVCGFCFGEIEITVDPSDEGDYLTIQEGIDAAEDGDTVIVVRGTYFENIDLGGKAITLCSSDPDNPEVVGETIIDGGGLGSVIACISGEGAGTVISGFFVTNGLAEYGGGISISGSSPSVTNCVFSGNSATVCGGGMGNVSGFGTVTGCMFVGNSAEGEGGGGMGNYFYSAPIVSECTFTNNTGPKGGGMYSYYHSSSTVDNCVFKWNSNDGVFTYFDSTVSLTNCTFCSNSPEQISGAYVDGGGNGVNGDACKIITVDGSGGADFTLIQDAIDAAIDGQEIVVGPGRYVENINMMGKAITLCSSDPTDEEIVLATIIDGNGAGSVITCMSGEDADTVIDGFLIINGTGTEINTNYTFGGGIYNIDSSPTVSNCILNGNTASSGGGMYNNNSSPTLSNCTFDGNETDNIYLGGGGGMYNNSNSSPTLNNCTFTENMSQTIGGGMFNVASATTLNDCTFNDNTAKTGGGMYNTSFSSPTLINCTFIDNTAEISGGGMINYKSSPIVINCAFSGNTAIEHGGGMANVHFSLAQVTNCTFTGNMSGVDGGGMYNEYYSSAIVTNCAFSGNHGRLGGGMYNADSSPKVRNSTFNDNGANYGGGIFNQFISSPAVINNCTFSGNHAGIGGGISNSGVYNEPNSLLIVNCTFSGNNAGTGGGINNISSFPTLINCAFSGNTTLEGKGGGGMYNYKSSPILSNCTFSANSSIRTGPGVDWGRGGGMYNYKSSPVATNCIMWGNYATDPGDQIYNETELSVPRFSYCVIEGSFGDGRFDTVLGQDDGGNIDVDPLFVDADGEDDIYGTDDDNLRLVQGSPCIDAANNFLALMDTGDIDNDGVTAEWIPIDLDGNERFADELDTANTGIGCHKNIGIIDMGAYESPGVGKVEGDVTGDGKVDMADLAEVASNWLAGV